MVPKYISSTKIHSEIVHWRTVNNSPSIIVFFPIYGCIIILHVSFLNYLQRMLLILQKLHEPQKLIKQDS